MPVPYIVRLRESGDRTGISEQRVSDSQLESQAESRVPYPQPETVACLDASFGRLQGASGQDANHGHIHLIAFGGNNTNGPIDTATACNAHSGRMDFESETFLVGGFPDSEIAHSLRADGFDASEDGTGRGTPLVPVAFRAAGQDGFTPDEVCPPIASTDGGGAGVPTIAFDCKASGRNGFGDGEVSPTLRSMSHSDSHQNGGGQLAVMTLAIRGRGESHDLETREDGIRNAVLTPNGGRAGIGVGEVAFAQNSRDEVLEMPYSGALGAEPGMKQQTYIRQSMAVRRLTPMECERLQGVRDCYTKILITHNLKTGKPLKRPYWAKDGPRYKVLGNSMAVPVMAWIGERIQMVEENFPI